MDHIVASTNVWLSNHKQWFIAMSITGTCALFIHWRFMTGETKRKFGFADPISRDIVEMALGTDRVVSSKSQASHKVCYLFFQVYGIAVWYVVGTDGRWQIASKPSWNIFC